MRKKTKKNKKEGKKKQKTKYTILKNVHTIPNIVNKVAS
jgi:hypothetical protein